MQGQLGLVYLTCLFPYITATVLYKGRPHRHRLLRKELEEWSFCIVSVGKFSYLSVSELASYKVILVSGFVLTTETATRRLANVRGTTTNHPALQLRLFASKRSRFSRMTNYHKHDREKSAYVTTTSKTLVCAVRVGQ